MTIAKIAAITVLAALAAGPALAQGKGKAPPAKPAPLTDCDRLAGNALDPEHVGPGVPLVLIDPLPAIAACMEAVTQHPDTLRFTYQLGRAYDANEKYALARLHYMRAADAGYAASYSNIGRFYDYGIGVEADRAKAAEWYQRGVDAGNANAMFARAVLLQAGYTDGYSVEAVALIMRAAVLDHPEAVYALAAMYADGDKGQAQDSAKALELKLRAADLGSSAAAFEVGNLYLNGRDGLPEDIDQAAAYFEIAGNGGQAVALYNLGIIEEYGHGGHPVDYLAALDYYRRASALGDASATYNIGALYEQGRGVGTDHAEAARWVFAAVKAGDSFAREKMGTGATQFSLEFRKAMQELLVAEGLLTGEADGVFGRETIAALTALAGGE